MANTRVPDVCEIYFQHKVLTRVSGPPTFGTLRVLVDELKANASSVPSVLGGGQYGHLGLLLTAAQFETLSTTPFESPINPGPFAPPDKGTEAQINAARDVWKEKHYTFHLNQAVEKALIAQVVSAVEPQYLSAIRNRQTGRYGSSVLAVLQHLFTTYGHITPQQLKTREMEICNMHFHMALPVDAIFNAIDELMELAEYALMPMSSTQAVSLAYVVFSKNPILLQDLRAWNRRSAEHRTWENMKVHLREAQKDLSSLPTAAQLYPQANLTLFSGVGTNMPPAYDHQTPNLTDASFFSASSTVSPATLSDMVNNVQQREADLLERENKMMTQFQEMLTLLKSANNVQSAPPPTNQNHNNKTKKNAGKSQNQRRKYCWTHGSCAHNGKECNRKAEGHKDDASFSNMLGGSSSGCYWLQE
jgi:hypothetical protein